MHPHANGGQTPSAQKTGLDSISTASHVPGIALTFFCGRPWGCFLCLQAQEFGHGPLPILAAEGRRGAPVGAAPLRQAVPPQVTSAKKAFASDSAGFVRARPASTLPAPTWAAS